MVITLEGVLNLHDRGITLLHKSYYYTSRNYYTRGKVHYYTFVVERFTFLHLIGVLSYYS